MRLNKSFLIIPKEMQGYRLDKALSQLLKNYSRVILQRWVRDGNILIDKQIYKKRYKLKGGEKLEICTPPIQGSDWTAQKMDLDIIYRDKHIIVINKPVGLVVHPGAGNSDGTLINGLLFQDPELKLLPRGGLVHRIDKNTSGLLVVARTEHARINLIQQLQEHSLNRQYVAVVNGIPISGETINRPIGRHPKRIKMAVTSDGKQAVTHIRVIHKFRAHSIINAQLETGRTHQIRVHLSWLGYPLVGDTLYGDRLHIPKKSTLELSDYLSKFRRHALHSEKLILTHPQNKKEMEWVQEIPEDLKILIQNLMDDYTFHQQNHNCLNRKSNNDTSKYINE